MFKPLSLVSLALAGLIPTACGSGFDAPSELAKPLTEAQGHCVAPATAYLGGKEVSSVAKDADIKCFGTFAESIAYATKGKAQLKPDATMDTLTREDLIGINEN